VTPTILDQVLEANAAYYAAFGPRDVAMAMRCWSTHDDTLCIGPMGSPALGYEAIERFHHESFAVMEGTRFAVEVLHARYDDPLATVTCAEWITKEGGAGETHHLMATNVFILEDVGWRLIHHHVSWRSAAGVHPVELAGRGV